MRALVTAGSPLRKYVDLFNWGNEIDNLAQLLTHGRWVNV